MATRMIENWVDGIKRTQSSGVVGGVKYVLEDVVKATGAGPILSAGRTYIGVRSTPYLVTISDSDISKSGFRIEIKDERGLANPFFPITIVGESGQTIDQEANATIACPYGSVILTSDGTNLRKSRPMEPQLVLDATSLLANQPVPDVNLLVPIAINIGPNVGTASDPVQVVGNIMMQVNLGGWYDMELRGNLETTTLASAYFSAWRNGLSIPQTLIVRSPLIPTTPESIAVNFRMCLDAGDQLEFRMGTTSPAANGLQLYDATPPAAFPGSWPNSATARLLVYRVK